MGDMRLNEILRYLVSGGAGLIILAAGFEEVSQHFSEGGPAKELGTIAIAFVIGAISYALFRGVFYFPLYLIATRAASRKEKLNELDIKRWKNRAKEGSLQPYLDEWASQIFLLYTSAFIGLVGLYCGVLLGLTATEYFKASIAISWLIFLAGLISAIRFQIREKDVFSHDQSLN